MIKSLIAFIKIFLTRNKFKHKKRLEDSDPMSSSYYSSHDRRKETSLRSLVRKGEPKYGLVVMLHTYQLMSLLKDNDKREIQDKIDELIKVLFDWKKKLNN